jgi:DNA polymerase-3 subunit epsilon
VPLPPRVTPQETEAHRAFIATLGDNPLWHEFSDAE